MGKTLKYVSEFTFPSDKGYSGSAGKTMVKAYARGGAADMKQDKAMVKAAVQKHERARHPGEPMTKLARGGLKDTIRNEREELNRVEAKRRDAGQEMSRVRSEMRRDTAEMKGMPMRRQYPVDRREPMIAMAKGGMKMSKAPAAPAPKSDMLYSKNEVAAKNVLDRKVAPPLARARGSVNMAMGGAACMKKGGAKK
jgi:hypothetical protein